MFGSSIPKIVLCGDSITQFGYEGWVSSLSRHFVRRADVVNRGLSGYNTKWYLTIFPAILEDQKPQLVVLFLGANDSATNPPQHVPLAQYKQNLEAIIALCPVPMILITPPPCLDIPNHQRSIAAQYRSIVAELGTACNIPVVDLWPEFKDEFLSDGLHLSEAGNAALFDMVLPVIEAQLSCEQILFKWWRDLD
jgi:lysophospholipase L1-like esterase